MLPGKLFETYLNVLVFSREFFFRFYDQKLNFCIFPSFSKDWCRASLYGNKAINKVCKTRNQKSYIPNFFFLHSPYILSHFVNLFLLLVWFSRSVFCKNFQSQNSICNRIQCSWTAHPVPFQNMMHYEKSVKYSSNIPFR